jgi:lipid A 3-O-deacylase
MKKSLLFTASVLATLLAAPALAQEHLTFSAGAFDMDDDQSANFGIEYRGNAFWHDLEPMAGVQVNGDKGVYGYVGLNYDWQFATDWYLTPNFAVGAYDEGSSKDLGGVLEFRSGIEVGYAFENNYRLGLAVHHLSNASIYDDNPGVEQVMLTYSIPVSF